ncbi:transposase [Bacillus canaveralius]|uniref:Transposase n=1 Tax=Bacillus canaveralius TaxID=1403243 RepID=A0A2N5GMG3_9BACI|nr:TnsA endonuclease N-terminal domain-containing protein [Bacillus canaveralius]PLR83035.1 transposase [Bacillus canaveralius]PLR96961.1 transposase [Bacillus canaveralius]
MLTEFEFLMWCEKNNIAKKSQEYINNNIRFAQPARRVGGGSGSTSGRYPSHKMGVTIQWESGKVEGPAVLMLENDEDVLEYYDQPNKIKLEYMDHNGRNRGTLYTPDFFVIRTNGAGWEEWKPNDNMLKISKEQKWKFRQNDDGSWSCPPGEHFAQEKGLSFRVCTTELINWNLHRNYVFLDDYLRRIKKLEVKKEVIDEIKQIVFQDPGITLKDLIDLSLDRKFCADDIYTSIVKNLLYVNLNNAALAEPETVKVFLHKEHAVMFMNLIKSGEQLAKPNLICFEVGSEISWDNSIWKLINIGHTKVSMVSDLGTYNEIPRELFEHLIAENRIIGQTAQQSLENDPIIDIITQASDADYEVANYRMKHVENYLRNGSKEYKNSKEPNLRKVRDWVSKYKEAKELFGYGYVGLLPKNKDKGNRTERFNSSVLELMNWYIEEEYENMVQKNKSVVYGAFKNVCDEKGYISPSLATFCKHIDERPIDEQTGKRQGKRAKYQKTTFYWELERTTPRHGDFPFNICHLDHTELDIELVCSRTGKNLGKPYLSLMVDAFSRRVIAFYLSFDPPSYRSCLMVFRDCVRRYNRLPQQIVVDNGPEFHSVYFETFLAMYEREPKRRPPAEPRYGSILERLFGTTNTRFILNLKGNTKIMKNVRQVTKSVNPKSNAVWDLPNLCVSLEEFFFELYDTIEHPALDQTPREAFVKGLFYSGERRSLHIQNDKTFEILTLPSTARGEATIQQSGVKINYIYYWSNEFISIHHQKKKVKVRYDPFNIAIAYVYLNKRWIQCVSQYYSIFQNMSERELNFITSEMRKSNKNKSRNYTLNAQRIAKFISQIEGNEKFQVLKAKQDEMRKAFRIFYKNEQGKPEVSECHNLQPYEDKDISISGMDSDNYQDDNEVFDVYGEF